MATARAAPKRQPEIDEKKESVRRSLSFTHTRQGKCVLTAAKVVAGVLVKGVPPSASLALGRTQPRGDNINPRVLHKKRKGPRYFWRFLPAPPAFILAVHSSQNHDPSGVFLSPTQLKWNHSILHDWLSHPIISPKLARWHRQ